MSSTIAVTGGVVWPSNDILNRLVWSLFLVGLFSLAAAQSCQLGQRKCGPFAIGQSAIGSCDYIGG